VTCVLVDFICLVPLVDGFQFQPLYLQGFSSFMISDIYFIFGVNPSLLMVFYCKCVAMGEGEEEGESGKSFTKISTFFPPGTMVKFW
jgi:hypothetical protein